MPDNPKVIVFGGPNLVYDGVQHLHGCELLFSPAVCLIPSPVTGGKAIWRVREDPVQHRTGKTNSRYDNASTKELLQKLCAADPMSPRQSLFKHYMEGCNWARQSVSLPDVEVVVLDCRMIVADLQSELDELNDNEETPVGGPEQTVDAVLIPRNRGVLRVKDFAGHLHTMSMTEYDNPLYNWFSTVLDSALQTVQIVIATDPTAPELSEWLVEMCHAHVYPECRSSERARMYGFNDPEDSTQPPPQLTNPTPVRGDIRGVTGGNSSAGLSFGQPIRNQQVLFFSRESLADFVYRSQRGLSVDQFLQQEDQQRNCNTNTRGAGLFQTFCEAGYSPLAVHTGGAVCAFRFKEVDRAIVHAMPRSFLSPDFRADNWPAGLREELSAIPESDILHSGFTWADVTLKFTLREIGSFSPAAELWGLRKLEVLCSGKKSEADIGAFTVGCGDASGACPRLKKRFPALIRHYAGLPEAQLREDLSDDDNFRSSVSELRNAITGIDLPMTVLGSPLPRWPKRPDLKIEVVETP